LEELKRQLIPGTIPRLSYLGTMSRHFIFVLREKSEGGTGELREQMQPIINEKLKE
jgi:hypothetical protein